MEEFITRIRTAAGDLQIDYNSLANLPISDDTLSKPGEFADAEKVGDCVDNLFSLINNTINRFETLFDEITHDTIPIARGGTGSSNGSTGLANLFKDGKTVLSSYQYGDDLPEPGTPGRIFFKRVSD